jgi:hypothetical protein
MLNFKFLVTMATKGHLKCARNHYFALILSHQHWFQSTTTNQWIKIVKGFSTLVTRYILIDRRLISSLHKSKTFLACYCPLQTPKQKRAHTPLTNPSCIFW